LLQLSDVLLQVNLIAKLLLIKSACRPWLTGCCLLLVVCCCCRELVRHREIFAGQQVLELGSGTGLVGLLAAAAGAQQVRALHVMLCSCLDSAFCSMCIALHACGQSLG
jgi:hypothetical protein